MIQADHIQMERLEQQDIVRQTLHALAGNADRHAAADLVAQFPQGFDRLIRPGRCRSSTGRTPMLSVTAGSGFCRFVSASKSATPQCLLEIIDQVLDVFDAHRQANRAVSDSDLASLFGGESPMAHRRWMADQRLAAAAALGEHEDLQCLDESPDLLSTVIQLERDDRTETVHLRLGQLVLWVAG